VFVGPLELTQTAPGSIPCKIQACLKTASTTSRHPLPIATALRHSSIRKSSALEVRHHRFLSLYLQPDDWKKLEANYRKMLRRMQLVGDDQVSLTLWHALGQIYRLHDTKAAIQNLRALGSA
jgi:hypothetical protein